MSSAELIRSTLKAVGPAPGLSSSRQSRPRHAHSEPRGPEPAPAKARRGRFRGFLGPRVVDDPAGFGRFGPNSAQCGQKRPSQSQNQPRKSRFMAHGPASIGPAGVMRGPHVRFGPPPGQPRMRGEPAAVALAVDHHLVGGVRQPVEGAVGLQRICKQRQPLLWQARLEVIARLDARCRAIMSS